MSIFKTTGFQSRNFEGVIYRWGFWCPICELAITPLVTQFFDFNFQFLVPRRTNLHLGEELCLGEPEAPNFPVFAMPRCGLLCLGVGPRLGEGPLRLGKPVILFLFPFFC